jgi:hypothetical protein
VINAIKFSIEEIEASDQYFDHTGYASGTTRNSVVKRMEQRWRDGSARPKRITALGRIGLVSDLPP